MWAIRRFSCYDLRSTDLGGSHEVLRGSEHTVTGGERPSWFVLHDRLDHPYAVVRKTPSTEAVFTRGLRWEPSDLLGRTDLRIEEVGHESQAGEARAAIEIAVRTQRQRGWPRYFALWKKTEFEPRHLHSVLRRMRLGGEEIHTGPSDLVWGPSTLLAEVAHHRGRWVEELSSDESADIAAHYLALAQRRLWQSHRWQGPRYHAIFTDIRQALDLANAIAPVRGDSWTGGSGARC